MSLGKVDTQTFSLDNYGFPEGLTVYPNVNKILSKSQSQSGGNIIIESVDSAEEVPIELITNTDLKISK